MICLSILSIYSIFTAYDVCGSDRVLHEPPYRSILLYDSNVQKIQTFLKSVAIDQNLPFYGNIMYASIESRLKTFNNVNKSNNQNLCTAYEAGFVYVGNYCVFIN